MVLLQIIKIPRGVNCRSVLGGSDWYTLANLRYTRAERSQSVSDQGLTSHEPCNCPRINNNQIVDWF